MNPLAEIVLADIQEKAKYAKLNQEKMINTLLETQGNNNKSRITLTKKELNQTKKRVTELEKLIPALYEDKVKGTIPENLCAELMGKYEEERKELFQKASELTTAIDTFAVETEQVTSWVNLIQNYSEITELNREILTLLIEKIEVSERKVVGNQKHREIRIHYRFVGQIG